MRQNKSLKLMIAQFSILFFFNSVSLAETPAAKYGRLPDGRAFRIDSSGYQLVDSIAELEVANDDLRKQVESLEDQLQLKNIQIKKVGSDTSVANQTVIQKDCSREVALARQQIFSLQNEISTLRRVNSEKTHSLPMAAGYQEQMEKELEAKNQQLISSQQSVQEQSKKVLQLTTDLEASRSEIVKLQAALRENQNNIGNYREEISILKSRLQANTVNTERAKLAQEEPPTVVAVVKTQESEIVESEPVQRDFDDLQQIRKQFTSQVSKINSLIIKRKDLLDSLKSASKGISVQAQPLVAKSGQTLDSLRVAVNKLNEDSDVDAIQTGLSQVEGILQDDIRLLSRLTK